MPDTHHIRRWRIPDSIAEYDLRFRNAHLSQTKEDHKGTFVKDITLKDIWPENRLEEWRFPTDETGEWFAGGSFAFSSDSLTLIHKTRWGNTVRIALANGLVSPR